MTPLIVLSPLLLVLGYGDMRHLRIPNLLVFATIGVFILMLPWVPSEEIIPRVINAGIAFAIGFLAFITRIVGGGDAKMFPALLLFVPPGSLSQFVLVFAISLLFVTLLLMAVRAVFRHGTTRFAAINTPRSVPMGVPMALSGLILPLL